MNVASCKSLNCKNFNTDKCKDDCKVCDYNKCSYCNHKGVRCKGL